MAVVTAVLAYRVYMMSDATHVSACKLLMTRGTAPRELAAALPPRLGALLDFRFSACAPRRADETPVHHLVTLDALTAVDSTAVLKVAVRHGEYIHNEQYHLVHRRQTWVVRRVTLDAGVVIH